MLLSVLHYLCLVTLLTCNLSSCTTTDNEEPRRTFQFRRAIDGTRGRKFYNPEDDEFLHSYGSSGRYDPNHQANDFSDIRNNVPGEPGVDYPSYTRLPQTGFTCEAEFRGYYADEIAGCQVFHVCDGSFLVSSFLCPVGSIFSQKLLTCDWWSKVDCSATRNYHVINSESLVSETDDDEILRKAFEMTRVQSSGERIPAETTSQARDQEHRHRILNYGGSEVTERSNDLQTGPDNYFDYPDYSSRVKSRFQSRTSERSHQLHREDDDYYNRDIEEDDKQRNNSPIRLRVIGEDRRNDRTLKNEFQPSYAPTVPTVITTTRGFYSPTFPTTHRPSYEREVRRKFDLQVESSDHLYTARGRSDETLEASTTPSVISELIATSKNISLPILVNSAYDGRHEVENMEESESFHYKTNVTLPAVEINTESSNEANVSKDVGENITETFSIFTIDHENHNPNIFEYNRKEETSPRNKTNIEISSTFAGINFTNASSPEIYKENSNSNGFKESPQEEVQQFRIIVPKESSTPKSHQEGFHENNYNSGIELIKSIEAPAIRIIPPLFDGEEATRESRVIRIILNKDHNSGSDSSSSINLESSIASDDLIPLEEVSEGERKRTKIMPEELGKEEEEVVEKTIEMKNLTSDIETISSTKVSSNDATSSSYKLENPHSIDIINAAVALEKSGFNDATEAPIDSSFAISEVNNFEDYRKQSDNEKMTISRDKSKEQRSDNEEILLNAKPIVSQDKNIQHSIGSEIILLENEKMIPKVKINNDNSFDKEETLLNAKTMDLKAKDSDNKERSNRNDEILLIGGNIEDTVVEGSSPFQVTIIANKDLDESDSNGNLMRKLISKQEIGDSIPAADHKNFDVVKSDETDASKDETKDYYMTGADSRSGRRIEFERDTSEERFPYFRSNNLKSRDYYRNIIALMNGSNVPRPFSLETPRNVEIKIPSDVKDAESSTMSSLTSGTLRNDLVPVATRIPSHAIRQSVASSSQDSESLEKLFASSKIELAANDEKILKQLSENFGERQSNVNKEKLIFELPQELRSLDFKTGDSLSNSKKVNTRVDDESEESKNTQRSNEKLFARTIVETEFIPSISFSLNNDEEREEYMEAVIKGLLSDVRATESTNNDTNTSVES